MPAGSLQIFPRAPVNPHHTAGAVWPPVALCRIQLFHRRTRRKEDTATLVTAPRQAETLASPYNGFGTWKVSVVIQHLAAKHTPTKVVYLVPQWCFVIFVHKLTGVILLKDLYSLNQKYLYNPSVNHWVCFHCFFVFSQFLTSFFLQHIPPWLLHLGVFGTSTVEILQGILEEQQLLSIRQTVGMNHPRNLT